MTGQFDVVVVRHLLWTLADPTAAAPVIDPAIITTAKRRFVRITVKPLSRR